MALYQIDIEKRATAGAHTGEYWTNRYIVDAADLDAADTEASYITGIEEAIHGTNVLFTKRSTRDMNPATDIYRTTPLNQAGTYGGTGMNTDLLPAMLCVRVDFAVAVGRPSRKFYHLLLGEAAQSNGQWATQVLYDINTNMGLFFAGSGHPNLVDPDGQPLTSGAALPIITVHQFRRGSKRKLQPIIDTP